MVNTDTDDVNKDKWHRQGHKWQRILSGVNKIYWTIVESRTAVITMQHISTLCTWKLTCRGGGFDLCLMPMYGLEAEGKSKDSMIWHARPVNFSRRNSRQNFFFCRRVSFIWIKNFVVFSKRNKQKRLKSDLEKIVSARTSTGKDHFWL